MKRRNLFAPPPTQPLGNQLSSATAFLLEICFRFKKFEMSTLVRRIRIRWSSSWHL